MNGSDPLEGAGAGAEVVLPAVLAGAGAAGNALVGAALGRGLRGGDWPGAPTGALLLSLGLADVALALYCLPPRATALARGRWSAGGFVCRTSAWLLEGCRTAKGLSWAALGRPRGRGWRLAGLVGAVWGAALLLALPHLLFSRCAARCALRPPPTAARFVLVYGALYPLLAGLVPSVLAAAALRSRGCGTSRLLPGLGILFQATWLPAWAFWLWERHGPPPPTALRVLAPALLLLDGALRPAVLLAASAECRRGLRGLCRGASPRALPDPRPEEPAEKVPPDVEHFWRERKRAVAGREGDPVPWEHQ